LSELTPLNRIFRCGGFFLRLGGLRGKPKAFGDAAARKSGRALKRLVTRRNAGARCSG